MWRFIIIKWSQSWHCCFSYTVVDTRQWKEYGDYWKKSMCETFKEQEAIDICDALNKVFN